MANDLRRSQLDMVIRLYYIDIQLSFRRGHEDTLIDFELDGSRVRVQQPYVG